MYIVDSISMNSSYNEKRGENQNAHFMFSNLFPTVVPFLRYGTCTLLGGYLRLCTCTHTHTCACTHTHTHMHYFLSFHSNYGYANVPQSYIACTQPVLLCSRHIMT